MSKGGNPPRPPDPKQTAAAQTSTNLATAQANAALGNVNQQTPWGNLTYNQTGNQFISDPNGQTFWRGPDGTIQSSAPPGGEPTLRQKMVGQRWNPDTNRQEPVYRTIETPGTAKGWSQIKGYHIPQYTAKTTLSPHGQKLQGISNQTELNLAGIGRDQSAKIGQLLGTNMNFDGLARGGDANSLAPARLRSSYADRTIGATRNQYTDALMERMRPEMDRAREAQAQTLANQGIGMGSRAYSAAQDDLARSENDARLAAILAGGDEMARMEGLARDRAAFGNMAGLQDFNMRQGQFNAREAQRAREMNERLTERNQPINEIAALLGGSQVQQPQFIPTQMPNIPTTDLAGLIEGNYANRANAHAQKAQQQGQAAGSAMSTIGMIAAAAMMMSDRNAKTDIEKVGKVKGHDVYSYRYKGDPRTQIGFMAQEVQKKRPEAVMKIGDFLHVDYGKALG